MAQIIFNPLVGVELPSTQEIRSDLGSRIQQAFQTSPTDPLLNIEPSSPMGQVLDLIVAEIEAKNSEILFLSNMVNPDLATGKFLNLRAHGSQLRSDRPEGDGYSLWCDRSRFSRQPVQTFGGSRRTNRRHRKCHYYIYCNRTRTVRSSGGSSEQDRHNDCRMGHH